jgi:hypothetical protein
MAGPAYAGDRPADQDLPDPDALAIGPRFAHQLAQIGIEGQEQRLQQDLAFAGAAEGSGFQPEVTHPRAAFGTGREHVPLVLDVGHGESPLLVAVAKLHTLRMNHIYNIRDVCQRVFG